MLFREINAEIWHLLGFYATQSGNSVPKSANLIYMAAEAFSHDMGFTLA